MLEVTLAPFAFKSNWKAQHSVVRRRALGSLFFLTLKLMASTSVHWVKFSLTVKQLRGLQYVNSAGSDKMVSSK